MAGKGGGAWKVAYADFVTAMMAFFMVMWLIASGDKKLKEAIAQHFRDPFKVYQPGGSNMPPRMPYAREKLIPDLEPMSEQEAQEQKIKNANLAKRFRGDRTTVGGMILFRGDSADLDAAGRDALTRLIPLLSGKAQKIELCGHAVRIGAESDEEQSDQFDAWELSYRRCRAVMEYLTKNGISPQRIRISQGGPYEPYSIGYNTDRLAYNARVEVFMLSETTATFQGSDAERKARFTESPANPDGEGKTGEKGQKSAGAAESHSEHAAAEEQHARH